MKPIHIIMIIIAFLVSIAALSGMYSVDEGDRAVVTKFGKITHVADAGLNFKMPFVTKAYHYSVRTDTLKVNSKSTKTADSQSMGIGISVDFNILPADVSYVHSTFGRGFEAKLENISYRVMKDVIGKVKALDISSKRDALSASIEKSLTEVAASEYRINIKAVNIVYTKFPPKVQTIIDEQAEARARVIEAEADERRAEIQARQAIIESNRDAEVKEIAAKAESFRKTEIAKAEAEAIRMVKEAEADGIRKRANALAKNAKLVDLTWAENWNGAMPVTQMGNGIVPLFNMNK